MAFTGYVFDSAEAILPYLELPHSGPTSEFCKELAERLSCYVVAGYPERLEPREAGTPAEDTNLLAGTSSPEHRPQRHVGANSAVLCSPSGECILGYRKTHMFQTDVTWAKPGTGFVTIPLPFPPYKPLPSHTTADFEQKAINLTLGICMDLNTSRPAEWAPGEAPYELADHCVENKTDLLVLLNAWLYSGIQEDDDLIVEDSKNGGAEKGADEEREGATGPDWHTLNFWVARLWPLWRRDVTRTIMSQSAKLEKDEEVGIKEEKEEKDSHETIVVACNRTGEENGKIFAGSSAIFRMYAGSGRPNLLHMMGRREEGLRIWNLL
ncbi:carbon-nitrogen hydrolase, partial [Tricholoma matsutake]